MARAVAAALYCGALGLGAAAAATGCTSLLGADYHASEASGGAGAGGGGAAGGLGGSGAAGGASGGHGGGSAGGGQGGAGASGAQGGGGAGGAPVLVDDGLVVRYYLDEAASGTAPPLALDAAPDPLDLTIQWEGSMVYVDDLGNRGLNWSVPGQDGRPRGATDLSKVETALEGATDLTVELVAEIVDVVNASRLFDLGNTNDIGRLTVGACDVSTLCVLWHGSTFAQTWDLSFLGAPRAVYHVVFDTTQPNDDDRLRAYVDGVLLPSNALNAVAQGAALDTGFLMELVLGNRASGDRSIEGTLYYAAMYGKALTDQEIQQNVAVLLVDDDAP